MRVPCEWPDGCDNLAVKSWPKSEPCPHIMLCNDHDTVKLGNPAAGALFDLWVRRKNDDH